MNGSLRNARRLRSAFVLNEVEMPLLNTLTPLLSSDAHLGAPDHLSPHSPQSPSVGPPRLDHGQSAGAECLHVEISLSEGFDRCRAAVHDEFHGDSKVPGHCAQSRKTVRFISRYRVISR